MIHYFLLHCGNTKEDTSEQLCTEKCRNEPALEFVAQEADDVVGLDDAHDAVLTIDDGQGVEVVFVEELGELVLMQIDGAG
jgi:hypothetical protein